MYLTQDLGFSHLYQDSNSEVTWLCEMSDLTANSTTAQTTLVLLSLSPQRLCWLSPCQNPVDYAYCIRVQSFFFPYHILKFHLSSDALEGSQWGYKASQIHSHLSKKPHPTQGPLCALGNSGATVLPFYADWLSLGFDVSFLKKKENMGGIFMSLLLFQAAGPKWSSCLSLLSGYDDRCVASGTVPGCVYLCLRGSAAGPIGLESVLCGAEASGWLTGSHWLSEG